MKTFVYSSIAYAIAIVGSGLYNWIVNGGEKGLWFGGVMGASALAAACLVTKGRPKSGLTVAITTATMVGGWFAYEAFVRHGGAASGRMYLMILLSLAMLAVAMKSQRNPQLAA